MIKRIKRNLIITLLFFIGIIINIFVIENKKLSESENNKEINDSLIVELPKDSVFLSPTEFNNEGYIDKKSILELEIYQYLKKVRVQHIWIVLAQARLESEKYTSKAFTLNNNLFGMKKSYQRPTVRENPEDVEHSKNYSYYKSWEFSVIDYIIWQTSYARNLSEEKYLDKLQADYAEDPNYKDIINKLSKQLKSKYDGKIK